MANLDNLTQAERIAYAKQNRAETSEVVQLIARTNLETGYARTATVSGTHFVSVSFDTAIQFFSIYSDADCLFTWNSADDADAVTNLATGNTSHFLPAGETQNLGITGVDITRMDFRNTSDDGAVTNTVYVSAFPQGTSAF